MVRTKPYFVRTTKPKRNGRGHPDIVELGKDTRWTKGQSGNPKGMAVGTKKLSKMAMNHMYELASFLPPIAKLAKDLDLDPDEYTIMEILSASMIAEAIKNPSSRSMEHILDRTEGKMINRLEGKLNTTFSENDKKVDISKLSDDVLNKADEALNELKKCQAS